MKKIILIVLPLVLIMTLISTPIFAKENQNNGKPFQELWDALNSLEQMVFAAIEDLQQQIESVWI